MYLVDDTQIVNNIQLGQTVKVAIDYGRELASNYVLKIEYEKKTQFWVWLQSEYKIKTPITAIIEIRTQKPLKSVHFGKLKQEGRAFANWIC